MGFFPSAKVNSDSTIDFTLKIGKGLSFKDRIDSMSAPIYIQQYRSPVGELTIGVHENEICMIDWTYRKMRKSIDSRIQSFLKTEFVEEKTDLADSCQLQFEEYFLNERKNVDLPLKLCGTEFQQEVWKELMQIPYGKTMSYLELSKKMENEKAIRAVASANGANALSTVVPCHRIIGQNGDLTGYAGGLPAKKRLLQLEGVQIGNQLELF